MATDRSTQLRKSFDEQVETEGELGLQRDRQRVGHCVCGGKQSRVDFVESCCVLISVGVGVSAELDCEAEY